MIWESVTDIGITGNAIEFSLAGITAFLVSRSMSNLCTTNQSQSSHSFSFIYLFCIYFLSAWSIVICTKK